MEVEDDHVYVLLFCGALCYLPHSSDTEETGGGTGKEARRRGREGEGERERENYIDASHLGLMRCSNRRLQNV